MPPPSLLMFLGDGGASHFQLAAALVAALGG